MNVRLLSPTQKLSAMLATFVARDDRKLGPGEVDALAAFYGGIPPEQRASVEEQITKIYRSSKYVPGAKASFLTALQPHGLTLEELEGLRSATVGGFLAMSKEAQFERMKELKSEWLDEGYDKAIPARSIPAGARTAMESSLARTKQQILREHREDGEDVDDEVIRDPVFLPVHLAEDAKGRGRGLVGYLGILPIDADGYQADETYYFNVKGQYLGNEYSGE